jgi:hypothetical protein
MDFFRLMAALIIFFFGFNCCTKNTYQLSETKENLIAQPWILRYTDSIYFTLNGFTYYGRTAASACSQQESLSFLLDSVYDFREVCNQPNAMTAVGYWILTQDSIIRYGLKTDFYLKFVTIQNLTRDSLRLIQFDSFNPIGFDGSVYVSNVYSH